jgi:hypothetical protein
MLVDTIRSQSAHSTWLSCAWGAEAPKGPPQCEIPRGECRW